MTEKSNCNAKFEEYGVCVLIPTYNNETSLAGVINDVLEYTQHVIVVNDGSTDSTREILQSYSQVQVVDYEQNRGKGWALRKGFAFALSQGYKYAITIDSDGQHFAYDLPVFLEKLESSPDTILIGARNMEQASVPGKSSFGNKFSNFWFKVETGHTLPDTQSGYRLYPLELLKDFRFFTPKYEFEIEVLVRASWSGIKIEAVPVTVFYAPKETRISHFRPFQDFSRVSVLNTVLVLITFLYIKPRDFFKTLFDRQKLKALVNEHLFNKNQSDELKAFSIGVGVFMGIVPLWGFQMMAGLFLAFLLRLNKALVVICSHVSLPPMVPIIIFLSYKMGELWMGQNAIALEFTTHISLDAIKRNLQQYILGSLSLAVVAGLLATLIAYFFLKTVKRKTSSLVG
ncbi:DUF2062 domain-containing protein [Solitalea longa]|uniref:DUF2062 domain-containing protein n=1 Tax=Solitalea longa TaxID=2079460 RepID=A0A2S5A361_9SPHI|nr:DUF2062 domain-containing protein [Solitalea longa]POY36553.1 DUF2062 domain-containing protein [Solitalea longa]